MSLLAFLTPSLGFETLFWIFNTAACTANIFTSVYLYISHDDMKQHMIEPNELSELLNTYMPLEYCCSWFITAVSLIQGPWWLAFVTLPLAMYNLKLFVKDRDHKRHFMTKRDYPKKEFKRVERTYLYKSCVYGLLLAASLVYTVLILCDWLQSLTKKKRH